MTKKKVLLVVGILIGIFCVVGISYAIWQLTLKQTETNKMSTACFNVKLQNEKAPIQLEEVFPVTDEEGSNFNPYEFTITNNCNELATYQINLEVLTSSSLENLDYIKASLNDDIKILTQNESVKTTLTEANKAYKLKTGYLNPKESETFYLRLWMDEETPAEEAYMNKTMLSKITITSSYVDHIPSDYEVCVNKYGENNMNCQVMASVDTSGKCPIVNDGTIYVNKKEDMKGYVCSAPDDYGTSYYYRGIVNNNYVKFGGYYWRILRLNGDGSIRMIYAGDASVIDSLENKEEVLTNGYDDSTTKYSQIGTSSYNEYWKKDNVLESINSYIRHDNAGVGYMYGNRDGIVEESLETDDSRHNKTTTLYYSTEYTYDETSDRFQLSGEVKGILGSNLTKDAVGLYTCRSTSSTETCQVLSHVTNVSLRKTDDYNMIYYKYIAYGTTSIEKAQTNINDSTIKEYLDTWYENHFKDTEYERYLADSYYCNERSLYDGNSPNSYNQLGYGPEKTAYKWYNTNKISLTCKKQNDRFTVNDKGVGNGDLKYSIGLINTDEASIAGGSSSNNKYYLYTGNTYLTMSPAYYQIDSPTVRVVGGTGDAYRDVNAHYTFSGVRPVINLKVGSLKLGSGTWDDPWRVE